MKKYLLSILCSCLAICAVAEDVSPENELMSHQSLVNFSSFNLRDALLAGPIYIFNGGGKKGGPCRPSSTPISGGIVSLRNNGNAFGMQSISLVSPGCFGQPLGGGIIGRPIKPGSIIPGVSVLSHDGVNGSGALRSHTASVMMGDVNDDVSPENKLMTYLSVVDFSSYYLLEALFVGPVYIINGGGKRGEPVRPSSTPIPGAVVLSHDNGNASGALRSHAVPVMMGDVNDDGKVDVLDVTVLNGYVLGEAPEGFNIEHANVNGDDLIDVGDVTALTHYVLNGTWPSAE